MVDNVVTVEAEDDAIPDEEELARRKAELGPIGRAVSGFFGRVGFGPPYTPTKEQMTVFWLVGLAMTLNHYDIGIFSLATPRFQAEFGISESEIGAFTAVTRFGVLFAFILAAIADTVGRQKLLMITIMGAATCTGLSAFAPNAETFIALQTLVRTFAYAEDMLCFVVIAEVMDSRLRGWAIGALAALGAAGHGLASIGYAWVDVLPYEWRALYVLGTVPMFLVAYLRRNLSETERFLALKADKEAAPRKSTFAERLAPIKSLATAYPGRLFAMCATIIPFAFGMTAAMSFVPKFVQDVHNYSPAEVSTLFLAGGVIAIGGNFVAGRLSDRFGRRMVVLVAFTIAPLAIGNLYLFAEGAMVPAMWIMGIFAMFAADVVLAAYGAELFPTSYRSTASAVRSITSTMTGITALFAQSWLVTQTGDFTIATAGLLLFVPLAGIVAWFALPETAGRSLEDISPEKG